MKVACMKEGKAPLMSSRWLLTLMRQKIMGNVRHSGHLRRPWHPDGLCHLQPCKSPPFSASSAAACLPRLCNAYYPTLV